MKPESVRLTTFGAPLLVGTVAAATAAPVVPLVCLGTALASVAGGIVANECGDLSKRLSYQPDLRNQDLTKTVGQAIGHLILAFSKSPGWTLDQTHQAKTKKLLQDMAVIAQTQWVEIVEESFQNLPENFSAINEENLINLFAVEPQNFGKQPVLGQQEWRQILQILYEKAKSHKNHRSSDYFIDPDLLSHHFNLLSNHLSDNFAKIVRQLLKNDFESGGKAFAGLVLDLLGNLTSEIRQNQEQILQKLTEITPTNPIPPLDNEGLGGGDLFRAISHPIRNLIPKNRNRNCPRFTNIINPDRIGISASFRADELRSFNPAKFTE